MDNKAILEEKNTLLKKQKDEFRKGKECAIVKAAIEKAKKVRLKEKGVISESLRDIIHELIKLGVPVKHVDGVLHAVVEGLDSGYSY